MMYVEPMEHVWIWLMVTCAYVMTVLLELTVRTYLCHAQGSQLSVKMVLHALNARMDAIMASTMSVTAPADTMALTVK